MDEAIRGLAMLDGQKVFASTIGGLWLVDLERGEKSLFCFQAFSDGFIVSGEGKRIALCTRGPRRDVLTVIDTATAKSALKITGDDLRGSTSIWGFAFVPRSNLVVIGANRQQEEGKTGPKDGKLHIYDIGLKRVVAVTEYMPWVDSVAASVNGEYLASGHFDSSIRLWDLRKLKARGKPEPIRRRSFLLDKEIDKAMVELSPSIEVRKRIDRALEKPRKIEESLLRGLRAIEVLETIATPEAREQVERLSNGEPKARLTRAAQAALRRSSSQ
jgi:hypothetical protein